MDFFLHVYMGGINLIFGIPSLFEAVSYTHLPLDAAIDTPVRLCMRAALPDETALAVPPVIWT